MHQQGKSSQSLRLQYCWLIIQWTVEGIFVIFFQGRDVGQVDEWRKTSNAISVQVMFNCIYLDWHCVKGIAYCVLNLHWEFIAIFEVQSKQVVIIYILWRFLILGNKQKEKLLLKLALLLKLPPRKLGPRFGLWSFFLLRLLCISVNLPYSYAWILLSCRSWCS